MSRHDEKRLGFAGRVAESFLASKLTPLLVVGALLVGAFAVLVTPREEEPQIQVPMIDVFAQLPGASAEEVEQRLIAPLEKALFEIPGVEHVYSTSQPSGGMVIVRYEVGSDPDEAVLRVHAKLGEVAPRLPAGVPPPVVVPHGIDGVPVLAYTLWSTSADPLALRQVASGCAARCCPRT
jgi:multidrug efflux pump subunit AcrB